VRLNYESLKKAIADKGNRGYKGQVQCGNSVWARLDPSEDCIHLKLHNTDIITFYPNGHRVLRGGGWANSQTTQGWWWEARIRVGNYRANEWTEPIAVYYPPEQQPRMTPFYDGMRINMYGVLLSQHKPLTKNVPSAQAKALRKRMLGVFNEVYLPHLRLMSLKSGPLEFVWINPPTLQEYLEPDDDVRIVTKVVQSQARYGSAWEQAPKLFRNWMDAQYRNHVKVLQLFDAVPYNPEEK
jgi:hypothetical protein